MLKQPSGTNHFQFRFHQFGFAVGEIGGGFCSTELFYFEREALCNRSLRCDLSLTHSVLAMQDAAMKLQHSLRIIFAGALIALMGACATMTPSGPAALAGTWTNSLGNVWTINADGTFHVTATKPKAEIWGNYTVAGDQITVQETRRVGPIPKSCKGPGVYKFSRPNANTLTFMLVSDVCKPRIQNVTQPWTKK